ncbi:hypothetical protein BDZ89DRAFT_1058323 [Hymenopellis radicata]|nr:hypothetical protein BDZ89DRAFT_1058323 [Hymenopellis radicata]
MFASSFNFNITHLHIRITHLHIRSPKSRPNESTHAASERRPIQKRKSSLNLRAQYHNIDSNKSTRVVIERRPIQKRQSSLNLRAQYHNIESARDVARTEPEVTLHDAYVVVL